MFVFVCFDSVNIDEDNCADYDSDCAKNNLSYLPIKGTKIIISPEVIKQFQILYKPNICIHINKSNLTINMLKEIGFLMCEMDIPCFYSITSMKRPC